MVLFWQKTLSGFSFIPILHFTEECVVVQEETSPQSIASAQRVLQPGNEGILQRQENSTGEALKEKDFNERKKKNKFFLQMAKGLKQKNKIVRNFFPRARRMLF